MGADGFEVDLWWWERLRTGVVQAAGAARATSSPAASSG